MRNRVGSALVVLFVHQLKSVVLSSRISLTRSENNMMMWWLLCSLGGFSVKDT